LGIGGFGCDRTRRCSASRTSRPFRELPFFEFPLLFPFRELLEFFDLRAVLVAIPSSIVIVIVERREASRVPRISAAPES
jgi:hypothetical protein